MRAWLAVLTLAVVLLIAVLARWGSLDPCEIARQEVLSQSGLSGDSALLASAYIERMLPFADRRDCLAALPDLLLPAIPSITVKW